MRTRKQLEESLERAHMDVAHYMAREVARHEQVKALRKIAKRLYAAAKRGTHSELESACAYYEKEME